MQSVAVGWQVYQITHSLFDLGLIGLAQFAPFLALILWAGHVADTHDRRFIVLLCMATQLLCSGLLLAFTLSGSSVVWPVFAVLVLFGSARAFMMPASQAVLRNLVPLQDFSQAVALSSSSFQVAVISGPVLGGLLYVLGPRVVYLTSAALLALSVLLMAGTRSAPQAKNKAPVSWHTLLEGLRFVWSRPIVLGAISLDLFAVLFGGATALLPAYAHDVLHAGPSSLGVLRTAPGAGAALCSMLLTFRPIERRVGAWMFGGVALFGVSTVVMGLTSSFAVALGALFLLGAGDMVSVYIRHLLVQYETPDEIRGRVSAVNAVFIGASNELGEFESGLTASWFGLVRAIVFGGAATLLVTGTWMKLFPVLSRMDRFPHHAAEDAARKAG
jgi:MFS family permease